MPRVINNPQTGLPMFVEDDGTIRMLANLPMTTEARQLRQAAPTFRQYLQSVGLDVIPRSKLKGRNNRKRFPSKDFITSQRNSSGCVGWSDELATRRLAYALGMRNRDGSPLKFSGAFRYAHINGNRDAGAMIGDSMRSAERDGICLQSEFDYPNIYVRQIPATAFETAKRFKLVNSFRIDSYDELLTAIEIDKFPIFPVHVGSGFGSVDSDGVSGVARGWGNHSVGADGSKFSARWGWIVDMQNSWGASWGVDGRTFLSEKHFNALGDFDAWVHVDFLGDPLDQNPPPTPKG
jgi:hypothetical protein